MGIHSKAPLQGLQRKVRGIENEDDILICQNCHTGLTQFEIEELDGLCNPCTIKDETDRYLTERHPDDIE